MYCVYCYPSCSLQPIPTTSHPNSAVVCCNTLLHNCPRIRSYPRRRFQKYLYPLIRIPLLDTSLNAGALCCVVGCPDVISFFSGLICTVDCFVLNCHPSHSHPNLSSKYELHFSYSADCTVYCIIHLLSSIDHKT